MLWSGDLKITFGLLHRECLIVSSYIYLQHILNLVQVINRLKDIGEIFPTEAEYK